MKIALYTALIYIGFKIFKGIKSSNLNMTSMFNSKKFEPVKPENIKIHFKDVAGMHEAKFEITEFV